MPGPKTRGGRRRKKRTHGLQLVHREELLCLLRNLRGLHHLAAANLLQKCHRLGVVD